MSFPLDLESYNVQQEEHWPSEGRVILSQFTDGTIIVYQTTEYQSRAGNDTNNGTDVQADTYFEDSNKDEVYAICKTREEIENDISNGMPNPSVRIGTSFVSAMYNCGWGKSSEHKPVLATLLTIDGFEEIMRAYVNDVKNQNPIGDVSVEWVADKSPTGEILNRFVPEFVISGKILQQFYSKWTISVKDITKYVDRQRRFVESGSLQRTWTPKETCYTSDLSNQCIALDIDTLSDESNDNDDDNNDNELNSSSFLTIADSSYLWKQESDSRDAILYLYGAFNPIHLGHVNALLESKRWLETKGKYNVCATRIAIASDSNIKQKYANSGELCIKFEHRQKLCELACKDHNFIKVYTSPFISQSTVGETTRRELKKPDATLVPLMGSDRASLAKRRPASYRRNNKFVLCVGRQGMSSRELKTFEQAEKIRPTNSYDFFVVPTEFNEISSTKVRQKVSKIKGNHSKRKSSKLATTMKELIELGWITESEGEYMIEHINILFF